jgi:hypothetical protein
MWLPILEKEYRDFINFLDTIITRKPKNSNSTPFPIHELIKVALESRSEYWVSLSLEWLDVMVDFKGLIPQLQSIYEDKSFSQYVRHKARKLMKRQLLR